MRTPTKYWHCPRAGWRAKGGVRLQNRITKELGWRSVVPEKGQEALLN